MSLRYKFIKCFSVITLTIAVISSAQPAFAQSFVDSTCYKYFQITAKLKKGDTLSRADWKTFISDKSIQDYMADQGVNDQYFESYRKNMQIVYMPKYDSILQKRLADPYSYWLTYMINQYKIDEDGMKAYLKRIATDPGSYFDKSYEYAYSALPKTAHKKLPGLKVAIIPIHNDAHAQEGLIIYTLLCAYKNDKNRLGALGGHELHHMLRPQPTFEIEPQDESAVMAMYRILNEGSADMVDKKYMTDSASRLLPTQRYFQEFFNEGKKILPHLDSLFKQDQVTWKSLKVRDYFKGTPFSSGHVPGTYMSHYIEKNGYKAELIKSLDDPFSFFLIYDKASKKDREKPFRFSTAAMKNIQLLKNKYIKK
jgi:hypothetical protein